MRDEALSFTADRHARKRTSHTRQTVKSARTNVNEYSRIRNAAVDEDMGARSLARSGAGRVQARFQIAWEPIPSRSGHDRHMRSVRNPLIPYDEFRSDRMCADANRSRITPREPTWPSSPRGAQLRDSEPHAIRCRERQRSKTIRSRMGCHPVVDGGVSLRLRNVFGCIWPYLAEFGRFGLFSAVLARFWRCYALLPPAFSSAPVFPACGLRGLLWLTMSSSRIAAAAVSLGCVRT